jgi:hypothetical protein
MRYVYVVEQHIAYEGSIVKGVYDDLDEARNNLAGIDDPSITRWDLRNQHAKSMPLTPGGKIRS